MSNPNKSAELAELKQLHTNLKDLEKTQKSIASIESFMRELSNKSYSGPRGTQLSTNWYENEVSKYIQKNQAKKSKILITFMIVAAVILLAMSICWLCLSGILAPDLYLQTPEIVREYSGIYYTASGHQLNGKLSITSCNKTGAFEGTFEFSGKEPYRNDDVFGKYSVTGKIVTKSKEGYVNATLNFNEWIDRPAGYYPLDDQMIKIYDNYQAIRGFEYDICLYATDRELPTPVADLNTPEIIGTYSGDFTPSTGKVGTTTVTIDSCDASGQVTGMFTYTFKQGTGTWSLTGQITEKYSDGSVKLKLNPDEQLASNYMFYYPSPMEVEIYNNYRSMDSTEGIHCFYEDEGFEKDPNPTKTPTQLLINKVAPIAFPAYIVVALVIFVILASKNTAAFTAEQQHELDQLRKRDSENLAANEAANKQRAAREQTADRQQITEYKEMLGRYRAALSEIQQKVDRCTLLAAGDKSVSTVESLIYRLESNRADSVKEALLWLDESNRRFYEQQLRMESERIERDRRIRAEADARWNQTMHNLEVERQQRRQAEELERIRKSLEE